jgi:glutamine synthetase type III
MNQALNAAGSTNLKPCLAMRMAAWLPPRPGPEQEYFLIDRNFYYARPDLLNGRPYPVWRAIAQRASNLTTTTLALFRNVFLGIMLEV